MDNLGPSAKYIVCIDRAGLGNRLKGLISAMRLSKITGRKLLLYWENNKYLGCDFNDLFDNEIEQINEKQLKEIKRANSKVYRDVLDENYVPYDYIILDTWKFLFLPGEIPEGFAGVYSSEKGENVDFEFERIPQEIRGMLLEELNSLKVKKEILDEIEKFSAENNVFSTIGLHIRRGDNWITVDKREKVSSDDKFTKLIKSMPNEKFLLCTDGEETEKKFLVEFSERIIVYPKGDRKRSKFESLKEALIDMILLSKTKKIYGSYLSTFSELAWWFGGCTSPITIVGEKEALKSLRPNNLLTKIIRKIMFYKVGFFRWITKTYE